MLSREGAGAAALYGSDRQSVIRPTWGRIVSLFFTYKGCTAQKVQIDMNQGAGFGSAMSRSDY